jgi:hypothetical protein
MSLKMKLLQVGADNFFGPEMRAEDLDFFKANTNGEQTEECDEDIVESLDPPVGVNICSNFFLLW